MDVNNNNNEIKSSNQEASSAFKGIANVVNSIYGVGILGLPQVACRFGLIPSIILQPLLAYSTAWTAKQIIQAKRQTNSQTYEEVCEKILGSFGYWMLNFSLWLMLICVLSMYICFAVKFTYPFLKGVGLASWVEVGADTFYRVFIGIIFVSVLPLLLLKDLSRLGPVSTLGMFAVMLLLISSTIAAPLDKQMYEEPATLWTIDWMLHKDTDLLLFLEQFGVLFTGYMGHQGICSVENSLNIKSEMEKVINYSFSIVMVLNTWFILALYVGYGGVQCTNLFATEPKEKYTENKEDLYTDLFSQEKSGFAFWLITIGSVSECISLIVTLPLVHFFLRDLTWSLYLKLKNLESTSTSIPSWFINGHLFFWLLATVMAVFLEKQILPFLSFIGAFAVPCVSVVLPVLLTMELNHGILYYLSFGILPKKICKFGNSSLKLNANKSFNDTLFMLFMNILLAFGSVQIALSFKILLKDVIGI
jgi:amino acid permease